MRIGEFRKPVMPAPKIRQKRCKVCREYFTPRSSFAKACGPICAQTYVEQEKAKKDRRERQKGLQALKTKRDYKKEAQAAWNAYVRARDFGKPCASCGATPQQVFGGSMDCSHYRSRGSAPHLAFHLHNAAAACVKCNRFLGGNVVSLRAGLVERFGEEKILAVEADNRPRHFTSEYYMRIKKIFTKKARRTMKRKGQS